jgi:hypothetical protein
MNKGDILYFKDKGGKWTAHRSKPKDYTPFIFDGDIWGEHMKIKIGDLEFWFNIFDKEATFYIWDWFLTAAEWRDYQIDLILEDGN